MRHAHAGFIFCLFLKKRIAIYFYCSIFTFFFIYETWERRILGLYFVLQSDVKSKLYTGFHDSKLFVYAMFI